MVSVIRVVSVRINLTIQFFVLRTYYTLFDRELRNIRTGNNNYKLDHG